MQKKFQNNTVYIDWTNLHKWVQWLWKKIDYKKFRKWLDEKYWIKKAYIFMWYIESQKNIYEYLKQSWFKLIFKESIIHNWIIKWNADWEMILKSVEDFYEKEDLWKVILVTWDWDFSCLIDFLVKKWVFETILIPNKKYSSYLIRKKHNIKITYLKDFLNWF